MSSLHDIVYPSSMMFEAAFPPSPPDTPSLRGSATPSLQRSSMYLPTSPRDSTCLPPQIQTFFKSQSFTPPRSKQTTPTRDASSAANFTQSGTQRRIFLPQRPNDFACPRPQPRQPNRKVHIPGQGDTICPYSIPRRTSSLQGPATRGRTSLIGTKISKSSSHRQYQHRRSPSRNSTSRSPARCSSSISAINRSTYPVSLETALESQAQLITQLPRNDTLAVVASIETDVSQEAAFLNQTPAYDLESSELGLYPTLPQSSLYASSLPVDCSTSVDSFTASLQDYNCKLNFAYDYDYDHSLPNDFFVDTNFLTVSANEVFPASKLDTTTQEDANQPHITLDLPFETKPLSRSSTTISNNAGSTRVNPLQSNPTMTDSPTLGFEAGVSLTDPNKDTDDAALTDDEPTPTAPVAPDYTSSFLPASQGGTGALLDTSRLYGRVLRPWN